MNGIEKVWLAMVATIITELLVWLAVYAMYCKKRDRLMFGKLRVRIFRVLLNHTRSTRLRVLWARLLFGNPIDAAWANYKRVKNDEFEFRVRTPNCSRRLTPLTSRITHNMASTESPDEAA